MTMFANRFAAGTTDFKRDVETQTYKGYVPPFCIFGNLFYVGNAHCSSHLIDTGEGLILIDTPYAPQGYLLIESIWEMGFRPADIRYILHTHAHLDHFGCTVNLVALSGAQTFMGEKDALSMVEWPYEWLVDPTYFRHETFRPDVWLKDGDEVRLGNTLIKSVESPGHTRGAVTFFFDVTEGGRTCRACLHGGAGFFTLQRSYLEEHNLPLSLQDDFIARLDVLEKEPVDIMLGNHPFHNYTLEKYEKKKAGNCGENPFIDPGEWKEYLDDIRVHFARFLAKDKAGASDKYE